MQSMGSSGTINVETESEDSNDDLGSAEGSDQYSFPGTSTMLKKSKKSQYKVKMPEQPQMSPRSKSIDSTLKEQNNILFSMPNGQNLDYTMAQE